MASASHINQGFGRIVKEDKKKFFNGQHSKRVACFRIGLPFSCLPPHVVLPAPPSRASPLSIGRPWPCGISSMSCCSPHMQRSSRMAPHASPLIWRCPVRTRPPHRQQIWSPVSQVPFSSLEHLLFAGHAGFQYKKDCMALPRTL